MSFFFRPKPAAASAKPGASAPPAGAGAAPSAPDAASLRVGVAGAGSQPVFSLKQARRRLSVVSDNKLIEGLAALGLGGDATSASSKSAASASVVRAYAGVSKRGYAPYNPRKRNQDAFVMEEHAPTGTLLLGVFDGHGEAGDLVSRHFSERIAARVFASTHFAKDPARALVEELDRLEKLLLANAAVDTEFSGSTGVVSLLRGRHLTVANVGDSRAILGKAHSSPTAAHTKEGGAGAPARPVVEAVAISEDHKPDLPAERARIEGAGGRVFAVTYDDGEVGPARVWLAHADTPGLAMSRSLGDAVAHSVGVSSVPQVHTVELGPADRALVLASDGLWEFLSNQAVVDMCFANAPDGGDPHEVADALIARAGDLWMHEEQVIDDTTVVIAFLRITGASGAPPTPSGGALDATPATTVTPAPPHRMA